MPDPQVSDAGSDGGEVLYNLATGAQPEDFTPALQPLAQGFGVLFQSQPAQTPGLLGSSDDIHAAIASAPTPAGDQASDSGDDEDGPSDETGDADADTPTPDDANDPSLEQAAARLSDRDRNYLDRYYPAAAKYARQYGVDPSLVLGLGIESAFGTQGTYTRTGDAFGMTGGSTDNMTTATSPEDNVRKFFKNFGSRIYGVGGDADAFINALQARDAHGRPVSGLKKYNSERPTAWEDMARQGIGQMQRDLPIYQSQSATRSRNPS